MGGLLIKQALINAHNNIKYASIKDATTGLAFFATPHNGGDWKLVSLGSVAAKIATAVGFQQGDDVMETLKKGSIFSDIMQELFKQQLLNYDIISFWGALDSVSGQDNGQVYVLVLVLIVLSQVVPRESARLGMPGDRENVVKLNADHRGVCKFGESQTDQDNFKYVRANIRDIYKKALQKSVPTPAAALPVWGGGPQPGQDITSFSSPSPLAVGFTTPQPPPHLAGNITPSPVQGSPQPIIGLMYSPTDADPRSRQAADAKNAGRWEDARQLEQQVFDEHQRTLGVTHLTTLTAAYAYTQTTFSLGYLDAASRWADWVIGTGSNALGPNHTLVLKANRIRGEILAIRGRHQQAEDILAVTFMEQQDNLGSDHPDTLETERALGRASGCAGNVENAETRLRHRLDTMTRCLGENHIKVASANVDLVIAGLKGSSDSSNWVNAFRPVGHSTIAIDDIHARLKASVGPHNQVTIRALRASAHTRVLQGETTSASDMLRRALSVAEAVLGRDHPETIEIISVLVLLHSRQDLRAGRVGSPAARAWCERCAVWLEQRVGLDVPETRTALNFLGLSYMRETNYVEAEKYFERLVRSYQGVDSKEARQANSYYQACRMNTSLQRRVVGGIGGQNFGGLFSSRGLFRG